VKQVAIDNSIFLHQKLSDPTIKNPKPALSQAEGWEIHNCEQSSRRELLIKFGVAGSAALLGFHSNGFAAEPPLETTALTLLEIFAWCWAPQYIAGRTFAG